MTGQLCKCSLSDKTQTVLARREDEQYGNIQCIMVAHGIHKVPLSDQRNHLHLDFTMCTSRYFSLQSFWARERKFKWFLKDDNYSVTLQPQFKKKKDN